MLLANGYICLVVFVGFVASVYPVNPNITTGFREITISYEPLKTPINITNYDFEVILANRPNYFVPFSSYSMNVYPNHTIKNLLIGETISYRVGARVNGKEPTKDEFSDFRNVSTKRSSLAQVSVIPGKPLNLTVIKNPDTESTHSVIVTWVDPTNIRQASALNDKDIQYKIDICTYNRFEPTKRDGCKTFGQILRNKSAINQSSLSGKDAQFYQFNFHPNKENEMLYIVTPVALNGTMGEAAEMPKRIDFTKTPPTPSNVNASDIYANQLTLSWDQGISGAQAYIEISPHHTQHEVRKASSNPFVVTGLKNGTEYEFKVGIYTTKNGGSGWSYKKKFTTTNEMKPTAPPASSSNALTASIFTTVFSVFVFLKLW